MPLLLHLDGLPGVGKTTLARLWAQEHPGSLCLDIDLLRRSLGGWRDGWHGLRLSLYMAYYEWRKFRRLAELWREEER